MKSKLLTIAAGLLLLAVVGKFYAPPVLAQVRAALVQDVDQPARAPFQVTVNADIKNFTFTSVPIPSGKRLVIDYVALEGAAQTTGAYVQPIVILESSVEEARLRSITCRRSSRRLRQGSTTRPSQSRSMQIR